MEIKELIKERMELFYKEVEKQEKMDVTAKNKDELEQHRIDIIILKASYFALKDLLQEIEYEERK